MAPKNPKVCNWAKTKEYKLTLENLVDQGFLSAQKVIKWWAPEEESSPQPRLGEVVVFTDHLRRGLRPPGSKFFRDLLHFFKLRPQDIGPNSMTNICQFQVLCEVYLQIEPSVNLFREFFYLNRQMETKNGASCELGGVSIQKRKKSAFPESKLASHPKGWNKTWFYCRDTSPKGENPLSGFRLERLSGKEEFPGWPTDEERAPLEPLHAKLRALTAHGLTGIDLIRCWLKWRIQPVRLRDGLMCDYSGASNDP